MAVIVMSVGAPPELTRALSSLLEQSVPTELIVVNSGGGDVDSRLPKGSSNIRVLSFKEVKWPGAARNAGIELAKAPYVAFLAADCCAKADWVANRLKRHRDGATAVASAVVNNRPNNLVAWASHSALFARRLPGLPEHLALGYGASYARELFDWFGPFDDIRIGEDTEFHQRIGKENAPEWAPDVQTAHANPTSIFVAWRDQYRRGRRSGTYWPQNHKGPILSRTNGRYQRLVPVLKSAVKGRERRYAMASLPLVWINLWLFELGAIEGKKKPDPVVKQDGKARDLVKRQRWRSALAAWEKAELVAPGRVAPILGRGKIYLRLGRLAEAQATYAEALSRWPNLLAAHQGLGEAAVRRRKWDEALEAWKAVERLRPNLPMPKVLQGNALLELGRTDEAEIVFSSLEIPFPDQPGVFHGLAKVALTRCDWEQAMRNYDMLWSRFGNIDALKKKVSLLLNLNRFTEVEIIVKALDSPAVKRASYLHTALLLLSARHDWEGIVTMLDNHESETVSDLSLLQSLVNVKSMLGRNDEALELIDRSTVGRRFSRRLMRITALIRDRRHEDARAEFQEIWKGKDLKDVPGNLLSAMIAAAIEEGGFDFAHSLLDRISEEAPESIAGDKLLILIRFQRERIKGLEWLSNDGSAKLALPAPPLEQQVMKIMTQRELQSSALFDLQQLCEMWMGWRSRHEAFFPDPLFVFDDAIEIAVMIIDAVDEQRPLSLIRLGDGEGNVLPYREELSHFTANDRKTTQRTWWGKEGVDGPEFQKLQSDLCEAIREADVLGIPDLYRISRVIGTDLLLAPTDGGKNGRGLLATFDFTASLGEGSRVLTSCHFHEALAYWGLWDFLLPRFGSVSLITCHADLAAILRERHSVTIETVHLIPPERKHSVVFNDTDLKRHYPEVFEELRHELATIRPGQVFLVAAGMLGKIYCKWIRDAGGIGIDVGSAVDFWCGYVTRGIEESTYHRGMLNMEEHFRKLATTDARIAKLLEKREESPAVV